MDASVEDGSEHVAALQRWESFGAVWRVIAPDSSGVTVALCRCDGGEEMERFSSSDPAVLGYLDGRLSSES